MLIKELDSSTIKTLAYDKDVNKLWLRFKSGALYEYQGVDLSVAQELVNAESAGHFFHENIKDKYTYEKVDETV